MTVFPKITAPAWRSAHTAALSFFGKLPSKAITPDDYRALLLVRETARICHKALAQLADGCITLACPGPAPLWPGDIPGQPLAPEPTGDAVFNYPSSILGAPVVTVPMMAVRGLPVGMQIMGQHNEDARMTAMARWIHENIDPTFE